ncbi:MAG: PilZ domain-containing protein [Thermodesulfobacteriota bacterium]
MEEQLAHHRDHQALVQVNAGTDLVIEISDLNLRIKSMMVGIDHDEFVLAKLSPNDLGDDFRSETIEEKPVTIMYRHGDVVYRFNTTLLNEVTEPARLFFFKYPDKIDELGARNKTRHACLVPAQTMLGNDIVDMDILDLSKEGCLCSIKAQAKKNDEPLYDQMQVDIKVDILVNFPVTNEPLNLSGKIRNISRGIDKVKLGIVFDDSNPAVKSKVEEFLACVQEASKAEVPEI